ncbi:MAG: YicC family protein [Lachnospiraceae bacterium]|nr:YicC family protein [Lachnospiraceae bacterium]
MIRSMTGFGRSETITTEYKLIVEMKAVNHRYSEFGIKMPKKLNLFEANIRALLKEYINRGKVDVFITYEDYRESNACIKYNKEIAKEYLDYLKQMETEFQIPNDITVTKLAGFSDVFSKEEQSIDEEQLWSILETGIRQAAEQFVATREREGENLKNDLLGKLDGMLSMVDYIEQEAPQLIQDYRNKLEAKVQELLEGTNIDESRIATEVVIYADKICVDEETVRLRSHINSTKDILTEGGSIGRKLDFIAQEMNREANTILSKANSLDISNTAIDLKTEIEKVREQIQNIE